jgi:hypothetical protein
MFFLNSNNEHITRYLIKIKPNEKAKKHKVGANLMGFQNMYILQFVKSSTMYYIKCVRPRIWISRVYVQELR